MEELISINNNFELIKTTRSEIYNIYDTIKKKISTLDIMYKEFVKTHTEQHFIFGLDSFHFQNKMLELENNNIRTLAYAIENRMYCEYYKLYKMLLEYLTNDVKDKSISDKIISKKIYPVYKDLEPLKNYNFSIIIELQLNISTVIRALYDYYLSKESDAKPAISKSIMGIHIDNIVNYRKYENALLHEKIYMFIRYLEVFNKHHSVYLKRLLLKSKLIQTTINEDIQLIQPKKTDIVDKQSVNTIEVNTDEDTTDEETDLLVVSNVNSIIELL